LWIEDAALECWQTIGPSGQARYTNAAIQTVLMLRTAFKLALRQIEGPDDVGAVVDAQAS
jgi:DDE family transposase